MNCAEESITPEENVKFLNPTANPYEIQGIDCTFLSLKQKFLMQKIIKSTELALT